MLQSVGPISLLSIFYCQVKRKNNAPDKRADSNELPSVSGSADLVNRAVNTPVSGKSTKTNRSFRAKPGTQTPTANVGQLI